MTINEKFEKVLKELAEIKAELAVIKSLLPNYTISIPPVWSLEPDYGQDFEIFIPSA